MSRETLRKWMSEAGLWQARRRRVRTAHLWRELRAAFGELVMMDSSRVAHSPVSDVRDRQPQSHSRSRSPRRPNSAEQVPLFRLDRIRSII